MNLLTQNKKALAAAAGAILSVGCGLLLHEFKLGKGLANLSYDLLLVWRGDLAQDQAAVVYLDEVSHEKLQQPSNAPWDRKIHARLIQRLTQAGAKAIVFDIVFNSPSDSEADSQLVAAARTSGRVVLGADNVRISSKAKRMDAPFAELADAAALVGSTEVIPDADMLVRLHTPEEQLPSLSWAAAELAGATAVKSDKLRDSSRWLNYYGPPNHLAWCSYYEALDPTAVPDSFFAGKTVFVGARMLTRYSGERKDEYRNPFSYWMSEEMAREQQALYMAGVEVQATAFLNLMRGDWLHRESHASERWMLVLCGILLGAALVRLHPLVCAGAATAAVILAAALSSLLLRHAHTWFPWLFVVAQILVALSWSVLYNSVQLYVQKRLYEHTLRLYLPPKLVKRFASKPSLLKPGAEKQVLTLFFSDIADFTSLSEGMDSDELAALMNEYFQTAVGECIHASDGTVAKYIGDAIFAFWNAPVEQPNDHAVLACEAALRLRELSGKPIRGRHLRTRIGVHTGVANVGNFGSSDRVDYTALGENVNLASRLEGLNKYLGTGCLISGGTRKEIGDRLLSRSLGRFQLKGFEHLVEVHELVGRPEDAESTRCWREAFAQALANFGDRNLELAEMGFREVIHLRGEDGPSTFYLQRIDDLARETSKAPNWNTFTILKEK